MEYYPAWKRKEILIPAPRWMNLRNIAPSEISQSQKDRCCVILPVGGTLSSPIHRSRTWNDVEGSGEWRVVWWVRFWVCEMNTVLAIGCTIMWMHLILLICTVVKHRWDGRPGRVAPLVGASSHTPKGCRLNSWSGHVPRFQGRPLVSVRTGGNQSVSLSLTSMCVCLSNQ